MSRATGRLVLGMRADFYGDPVGRPELLETLTTKHSSALSHSGHLLEGSS